MLMDHEISLFWSMAVVIGFFGWIVCTVVLIFRGLTEDNHLVKNRALFWGILIVIFYAVWIIGLKKA